MALPDSRMAERGNVPYKEADIFAGWFSFTWVSSLALSCIVFDVAVFPVLTLSFSETPDKEHFKCVICGMYNNNNNNIVLGNKCDIN